MKKTITLLVFSLIFCSIYGQENLLNELSNAFASGNAKLLYEKSEDNVKLSLLAKENIYTNEQVRVLLKAFFDENPPIDYTVVHKGNKDNATFVIGDMKTTSKTYRIFYLLNNSLIQQLRIEEK